MRYEMRYILLFISIWLVPLGSLAQESQSLNEQTRLIRIKKIAAEWQGSILTLHTRSENEFHGRLIEVKGGNYYLETGHEIIHVPLEDVVMVSFKPGLPEMFLGLASTFLGGALLGGALMISSDTASQSSITIAALLGSLGGGLWGYSTFYESEVIHLE